MRSTPRQTVRFITGSEHKFAEIDAVIGGNILQRLNIDLPEIQEVDPKEIIMDKLLRAMTRHQGEFIVEDTSLFMECMPGLPGPLIKWFMQTQGRRGLWNLADKLGRHQAEARTTIGYASGPHDIHFFTGSTFGRIVAPRGQSNFGWDPVFQPDGESRTYAEMTLGEKNAISHRGRAARELKAFLDGRGY